MRHKEALGCVQRLSTTNTAVVCGFPAVVSAPWALCSQPRVQLFPEVFLDSCKTSPEAVMSEEEPVQQHRLLQSPSGCLAARFFGLINPLCYSSLSSRNHRAHCVLLSPPSGGSRRQAVFPAIFLHCSSGHAALLSEVLLVSVSETSVDGLRSLFSVLSFLLSTHMDTTDRGISCPYQSHSSLP